MSLAPAVCAGRRVGEKEKDVERERERARKREEPVSVDVPPYTFTPAGNLIV